MKRVITSLVLIALALCACNSPTPAPRPSSPLETPVSKLASPLPTPQAIPTPKSDRATITGILSVDSGGPQPVSKAILYLGQVHQDSRGTPVVSSLDRLSPLRAQTDDAGRFVFTDVPVGQYTLILDRIDNAYLLGNPKTSGDLLFEPKAGQVLDLGNLVYSSLPGTIR